MNHRIFQNNVGGLHNSYGFASGTNVSNATESTSSTWSEFMATLGFIEYKDANPEVRAVYDDIMATRKTDWINNFWKALAHDPATLKRTWESIKQIMGPGALDPLVKEMIYVAVSVTNQCGYCIASHTVGARNKGMSEAMFHELMAVVGMANETNRLASGYQVEIDEQFKAQG
jgi:AhpD family alkylhydroperoxidase